MASVAVSIGVFALVVMLFIGGYTYWQYYTVSSENSDLRKTLNATDVDNVQLRSQLNSLQQQVTSLQAKVDSLEAAGGSEKLNISSAFAYGPSGGSWEVQLLGLDNGSAAASINQILVNGGPVAGGWRGCAGDGCGTYANVTSLSVPAGSPYTIRFSVSTSTHSSGQTIDVRVVTAQTSYRVLLVLPGTSNLSESMSVYVANATAITSPAAGWAVMISGRNTAPGPLLFNQIQVNGLPLPSKINVSVNGNATGPFVNASISAGDTFTFAMNLSAAGFGNLTFTTGQTIEVRLVTTQGSYPLQVLLPASTQYEDLQVSTGYAVASGSGNWAVVIGGYNAGTAAATVQQIQVNGQMAGSMGGAMVMSSLVNSDEVAYPGTVIPVGATFNYVITVSGVSAGQTIQVKIVTAQGSYPVQVVTS
jgi:hypothetical protein